METTMRKVLLILATLLATQVVMAENFVLTSPQLKEGGTFASEQALNAMGCTGGNISPALLWKGAPAGTKSFAVTVYDQDVLTGSGWWHWVIFNIPAHVTHLAKGAGDPKTTLVPGTIQSRTDFGTPGYGGPCPPLGDKPHRYQITVYALKTDKLPLDETAPAAMVGYYLHQNLLAKAVLQAQYGR